MTEPVTLVLGDVLCRLGAPTRHVYFPVDAYMLGVRRVGVTQAAGALQRRGLIEYHRAGSAYSPLVPHGMS